MSEELWMVDIETRSSTVRTYHVKASSREEAITNARKMATDELASMIGVEYIPLLAEELTHGSDNL